MKTLLCKKNYNFSINHETYIKGISYNIEIVEFYNIGDNDLNTYYIYNDKSYLATYFYDNKGVRHIWNHFYTQEEMRKLKLDSL
jgi:hypothetical protein